MNEVESVADLDVEAILKKYEATITWNTSAVEFSGDEKGEVVELPPEYHCWVLSEKHGVMSLYGIESEEDARLASALFLYLWGEKKVPVAIAFRCAVAHVSLYYIS